MREADTHTPTRRRLLASSGIVASSALLSGCVGGGGSDELEEESGSDGNGEIDLIVTQQVEPDHDYDPVVSNDVYTGRILEHIYNGLYERGEDLELEPVLATDYPEVERDGTRYLFELRDDVTFHNGDPLTAEDVVHSIVAPIEEETDNAPTYDMVDVDGTEAIDELSVQIDLKRPHTPFELDTMGFNVVNKSARLEDKDAYNKERPIGTGPFKYVDHTEGEFAEIERWDDWWGETEPKLDRVRWRARQDGPARVSAIRSGDTDIVTGIPDSDWSVLQNENLQLEKKMSISYFYLAYNCNEGPTAKTEVRQGIEHAFSMSGFVTDALEHTGVNAVAPLPEPQLRDWELPIEEYAGMENEYDPERAAELLDGNVPDGWQPRMIAPPDNTRQQLVERVASRLDALSEYGVTIDPQVRNLDWGPFLDAYNTGNSDDYAMYALGWSGGRDPDAFMYNLFHEESEGLNQGHYYADPEFHETILKARSTRDRETRRELYDSAIRTILEETVHSPGYTTLNTMAALPRVQDLSVHSSSVLNPRLVSSYNNVAIE